MKYQQNQTLYYKKADFADFSAPVGAGAGVVAVPWISDVPLYHTGNECIMARERADSQSFITIYPEDFHLASTYSKTV